MKNLNVTKAEKKNAKNFDPVDNICFFFFFFSSIEMQVVKNGSMPFNQVKGERENASVNYEWGGKK